MKFFSERGLARCWLSSSPWLFSFMLVWNANTERDLAGYKVFIGEKPQQYHTVIDVGNETSHLLSELPRDKTFYFVVTAYDTNGNESGFSKEVVLPAEGSGEPSGDSSVEETLDNVYNFPNPFRANGQSTTIRYYLSESQPITISVFNLKGDLVKTILNEEMRLPGEILSEVWDGTNQDGRRVSPGLYYAQIKSKNNTAIIRIAMIP